MSRVAKNPVTVPKGVEITLNGQNITVKGPKGSLNWDVHPRVEVVRDGEELKFSPRNGGKDSWAFAGTTRALVNNMVKGVTEGFERKLQLVGVGYRAQAQGKTLNLTLGFSHPVSYEAPEGITFETPSQTEILVKGIDRQAVGQAAAKIRAFRAPEPYKGKGVRYADETISLKEAKKK
jgi:large subunit ribosomal protein L6